MVPRTAPPTSVQVGHGLNSTTKNNRIMKFDPAEFLDPIYPIFLISKIALPGNMEVQMAAITKNTKKSVSPSVRIWLLPSATL